MQNNATKEMSGDNISFLLDLIGNEVRADQFVREYTFNAVEAIHAKPGEKGTIEWLECNKILRELGINLAVPKLAVIDNGVGMSTDQLLYYLNNLAASGKVQGLNDNYGLGAKCSGVTKNPFGLIYITFTSKCRFGTMIWLWQDPDTGKYGLKMLNNKPYELIPAQFKSTILGDNDSGTLVAFLGKSECHDTTLPHVVEYQGTRWLIKAINTRIYKGFDNITIKVQSKDKRHGTYTYNRHPTGQAVFLNKNSLCSGQHILPKNNMRVHWFILDPKNKWSSLYWSSGHIAVLYKNELYPVAVQNGTPVQRLRQFGIRFGGTNIVLYIEPLATSDSCITTNAARTRLIKNNKDLPMDEIASEFSKNMPEKIREYVEEEAKKSEKSSIEKLEKKFQKFAFLFNFHRFTRNGRGSRFGGSLDEFLNFYNSNNTGASGGRKKDPHASSSKKGSNPKSHSQKQYDDSLDKNTPLSKRMVNLVPKIEWANLKNQLDNRAAQYFSESNIVQINKDYYIFTELLRFFTKEYGTDNENEIWHYLQEICNLTITETIVGIRAEHSFDEASKLLTPECLTATLQQRVKLYQNLKLSLRKNIGSALRENEDDNKCEKRRS